MSSSYSPPPTTSCLPLPLPKPKSRLELLGEAAAPPPSAAPSRGARPGDEGVGGEESTGASARSGDPVRLRLAPEIVLALNECGIAPELTSSVSEDADEAAEEDEDKEDEDGEDEEDEDKAAAESSRRTSRRIVPAKNLAFSLSSLPSLCTGVSGKFPLPAAAFLLRMALRIFLRRLRTGQETWTA